MYKLYQVAVLELPKRTKKDDDEDYSKIPTLVLAPTCVLARSDQDAAIKIAMKYASDIGKYDQERLEVVVRPF